jgi:two-component system, chemotaxis family, protein-glutamate methylesterase/glutaminase
MIVNPDSSLTISRRERLQFFRPSADWLFASVAASFADRAFGVVLSGLQNDGALGVKALRAAGGTVVAQDPGSCERPQMPRAAIATGAVDFILAPDQMPIVLTQLLNRLDIRRCKAEWDAPFLISPAASHS